MAIEWESPMRWDNTGSPPSENLQINGFSGGYKPPASVFNYFFNNVYKCIKQLHEIVSNIKIKQDEMDEVLTDFDCGLFVEDQALSDHMTNAYAHTNLEVDGNTMTASETGDTLAEHEIDTGAHSNIELDGNET